VAITSLKVLVDEEMTENSAILGEYFRKELRGLNHQYIGTVRGKGLFNAIVINHPNRDMAWEVCLQLKENGLIAKPTHHDRIRFAPPLLITKDQIDECVAIIKKSLDQICAD